MRGSRADIINYLCSQMGDLYPAEEARRIARIVAAHKCNESEIKFLIEPNEIIEIEDIEVEIQEDEVPEEVETRCKLGDIWQLGEHRLICGDSTDVNVIDRLMGGGKG